MSTNLPSTESMADLIRDKVRKVMFEAIPDDAITQMIKKDYDAFFQSKTTYGDRKPSAFESLVDTELRAQIKDLVKTEVNRLLTVQYDPVSQANHFLASVVELVTPAVIEAHHRQLANNVLYTIKNSFN